MLDDGAGKAPELIGRDRLPDAAPVEFGDQFPGIGKKTGMLGEDFLVPFAEEAQRLRRSLWADEFVEGNRQSQADHLAGLLKIQRRKPHLFIGILKRKIYGLIRVNQ